MLFYFQHLPGSQNPLTYPQNYAQVAEGMKQHTITANIYLQLPWRPEADALGF